MIDQIKQLKRAFSMFLLGLLAAKGAQSQLPELFPSVNSQQYDHILYYPVNQGLQLIEIDHYSGYALHQMRYVDKGYVPPYVGKTVNEYFIRDTTGQVIKSFNTNCDLDSASAFLEPVGFVNRHNHTPIIWSDYDQLAKLRGHYDVYEDALQGVIDSLGNIVIPIAYETILHKPNCFLVNQHAKWSFITVKDYQLHPVFFEAYYQRDPLIYFSDNRKLVCVYNYQTGLKHDLSQWDNVRMLAQGTTGMAWIQQGGKWGLWNYLDDTEVLPLMYDSGHYFSYFFSPPFRRVVIVSQNGKMGLISLEGDQASILLKCEYDNIYPAKASTNSPYSYKEGFITVEKHGQKSEFDINQLPLTDYKE